MSHDPNDALDAIEVMNSLANMASATRGFYKALRKEGFNDAQALHLTDVWLASITAASNTGNSE